MLDVYSAASSEDGHDAGDHPPRWTLDGDLAYLDDAGIDLAVLSISTPAADVTSPDGAGDITHRFNTGAIAAFRANARHLPVELAATLILLLTTTGAKSRVRRTVPVVYARIGTRVLIVASMATRVLQVSAHASRPRRQRQVRVSV
jgi:hypothetical protein